MPLSPQEVAKRAFVSLLLVLARSYSLVVDVRRESPDADLLRAFKRVSRAVHPDKGGDQADFHNETSKVRKRAARATCLLGALGRG